MMAVHVAADPQWAPCGECNCVDGRAPYPRWTLDGETTNECPRQRVTDDSRRWLSLYPHHEKGHLFLAGGISDQPAIYLEAMTTIASAIEQARRELNG